jgi:hypothetical protein
MVFALCSVNVQQQMQPYPLLRLRRKVLLPDVSMQLTIGRSDSVAIFQEMMRTSNPRDIGEQQR